MSLQTGAERHKICKCGHIRYCHVGDTGKCLACDCNMFIDEKDRSVITIEAPEVD